MAVTVAVLIVKFSFWCPSKPWQAHNMLRSCFVATRHAIYFCLKRTIKKVVRKYPSSEWHDSNVRPRGPKPRILAKLNYIPKIADYCELAICNGDSFDFSLTWGWDMAQWHNCAKWQNGKNNLQQINFCTIRHIIDGVCCHDFRRRFYHVWDFSVMSSHPSSRMICCKKPIEGFEPTTCRLRCECTTVVLYRQKVRPYDTPDALRAEPFIMWL